MGLFGKRGQRQEKESALKKEMGTEMERLENEFRVRREENRNLEEKVRIVKEEYDATIGNLMAVKKELNQKKLELDVAQREHRTVQEKIRELEEIKDGKRESGLAHTRENVAKLKKELEEMVREHKKVKDELAKDRLDLHNTRKQHIDAKKELEEANAGLYNARTELAKRGQFQEGVLAPKEKEFIEQQRGKGSAGVIEAASAVVGSLKSKLNDAQKEIDTVQGMLEKEREAHAKTRRELERIKAGS